MPPVQLVGIGVTIPSVGVSLTPTTPQLPWSGESLLNIGVSLGSGALTLSNTTIGSASSVGTVVGDFAVANGSTRVYTFSLVAGTSLFSVTNSTLSVNAALSTGSVPITAQASDTGTSVITGTFVITIISTVAAAFVPTFELFGF